MKRTILKTLVIAAAALITQSAGAAEYLVKYRNPYAIMNMNSVHVNVVDVNPAGQLVKVKLDQAGQVNGLIELYSNPNVEYVVRNFKLTRFDAPITTTALRDQYAIAKVNAEKAWQRAGNRGSRNILVSVIDTGTDYRHPALAPNMVPGYDFAKNDNDPMDQTSAQNPGHGTHCSGILGATGLIDGGTVGLSPEVSIMPIRFLDENGSGDLNNGIKAIDYAIEKKVRVISASWGAEVPESEAKPLIEAVARAEAAGIIFVAAAGNSSKNNDKSNFFPTNAPSSNVIAVAASNSSDGKPSFSNFGRAKVHIAAPGEGIISTLPGNKYGNLSGTSMAAPLVSGFAALILAQDPNLKPFEVRALMQASGAKVGIQTACDCRIDAFNAVDMIKSQKMFVAPNAATLAKGGTQTFSAVYGSAPFKFASSNTAVATIDDKGVLTAVADGETTVSITDSKGVQATSYKINVGGSSGNNPGQPDPGQPDQPGGGDCPLGSPELCQIICQIQPDLPFCQQ